jgi:hypothetical protein
VILSDGGHSSWSALAAGRRPAPFPGAVLRTRSLSFLVLVLAADNVHNKHWRSHSDRHCRVEHRRGTPLPTAQTALMFLGILVETAIARAPEIDFVSRAAWPVDVIEISRNGISEQRYKSLDELKASAGLTAALGIGG